MQLSIFAAGDFIVKTGGHRQAASNQLAIIWVPVRRAERYHGKLSFTITSALLTNGIFNQKSWGNATHHSFRYCRVCFKPFLEQPFSKQLYPESRWDGFSYCEVYFFIFFFQSIFELWLLISAHTWEADISFRTVPIHHREQHLRFKTHINNSLPLARKFVGTNYLFWEANSFQMLEENFEFRGIHYVQRQISRHILSSNVERGPRFDLHIDQYSSQTFIPTFCKSTTIPYMSIFKQ